MTAHEALLERASASLSALSEHAATDQGPLSRHGSLGRELGALLDVRSGFYAFESALLLRPLSHHAQPLGLIQWNAPDLWKRAYSTPLDDILFFGEDIFGVQFGLLDGRVCQFSPETGDILTIGSSIESWCAYILEKPKSRTGYPLAHSWQLQNGSLPAGQRLLPKVPFVLGGTYSIDNLYAQSDVEGMRFRASVANQLKDLPDGSQVRLKLRD